MIARSKALLKRYWPRLKLRTILLTVLLSVAAMPVAGAGGVRVAAAGPCPISSPAASPLALTRL